MDTKLILILVAIVAVVAIYFFVREKINLRRAAGGEDKERLKKAVAQVLPGENGYEVAYGHYEKVQHYGRKPITTYYCYGLAFDASRIWIIPLAFDNGIMIPGEPFLIAGDMLGIAEVRTTNDKEGRARRVDWTLYDKNGVSLLDCIVEVSNTRKDSYHHVNIIQEEECDRFGRLIGSIAARVNRDHAELRAQVHAAESSTRKASILGAFSIVFSIFFPPAGLILSLIGLRQAKQGRIGNTHTPPLVLCRIALVISVILTLLEAAFLFMRF